MLYAVAAAVIGGTSLFGGRGKPLHALLGGIVIAAVFNGLGLMGVSAAVPGHGDRGRADRRRDAGLAGAAPRVHEYALARVAGGAEGGPALTTRVAGGAEGGPALTTHRRAISGCPR